MGTRNLTMVIDKEGVKKVAQYGQWDGYPSGVGLQVLRFLNDKPIFEKMTQNLSKVRFADQDGKDKDFLDSYDANTPEWSNEPDNRTQEQKRWFNTYVHRDLASEVLVNIANSEDSEILLMDRTEAATGDGWVEWSYIINLQNNTLDIHDHIDNPALKTYSLSDLPSEETFLTDLEGNDDDEEDED